MKVFKRLSRIALPILAGFALLLSSVVCAAMIGDDPPRVGGVLVGPCGLPGAEGPTGIADDFTNPSINAGIASVSPEGVTTAAATAVFRNIVQNGGTADGAFGITVPPPPEGFRVYISLDEGAT